MKNQDIIMETTISSDTYVNEQTNSLYFQKVYHDWMKLNRNIKTILECTEQSLFFLNSNLNIENNYSKCLEKALNQDQLTNKNFVELLQDKVPESVVKDTQEYLELMFKDELDVEIINELNPLTEVEFHFEDNTGLWSSSKYFSFVFKRIYENGKIAKLFCTIKDISEEKSLEEKLRELQDKTEKQLEWLFNIMHVEPPLLREFLEVTEYELNHIDKGLKNSRTIKNFKSFAKKIQRTMNQMQNNASLLNLTFFIHQIKEFETEILDLKKKNEVIGTDFIAAVFQLSKLKLMIDDIKKLMKKFKYFKDNSRNLSSNDGGLLVKTINKMVTDLSGQLDRSIKLEHSNFDTSLIPVSHQKIVREFLIILTRFSIFYGIEKPHERKEANKNPVGTIAIETFSQKNVFGFKLKHDGRLVKIERLLQKTVESTNAIVIDEESTPEKEQLGSEVVRFLFMPSMATHNLNEAEYSKEIFKDMELVKKKLKMHGGKIKITFSSEQHCEYTISFFQI